MLRLTADDVVGASAVAPQVDPREASPRRTPRRSRTWPRSRRQAPVLAAARPGRAACRAADTSNTVVRVKSKGGIAVLLQGKTALVTGADSGIGRATAITFGREGADVAVHYHADERGAEQAANAIRNHGCRAEVFQADFAEPAAAERLFAEVLERLGRLDILVNNAGTGENTESSLDLPTDEFLRVLNVDLVAPWVLAREAANHMVAQGGGVIVNVTSVHEEIPPPGGAAYCAAKGGLRMVTRTLALELARQRVRINNVAPGMIATPMTMSTINDPQQSEEALAKIPMGRPGEEQEIADLITFLASDKASYVTGSTFFADGGLMQKVGLA